MAPDAKKVIRDFSFTVIMLPMAHLLIEFYFGLGILYLGFLFEPIKDQRVNRDLIQKSLQYLDHVD